MRRAVLLLAVMATALLLAAGSLLPRAVFRVQDELEQASPQPVTDQQLSLDLVNPEEGYWSRLKAVGSGAYSANYLAPEYMTTSAEEAEKISWALMEAYQDYIPNYQNYSALGAFNSSIAWNSLDGTTFRIWNAVYIENSTDGYVSILVDDETGLPLSIYCSYEMEEEQAAGIFVQNTLLSLSQTLLQPFREYTEAAGCTDASLNRYPMLESHEGGNAVIFNLEYGGEQPAEVMIWVSEILYGNFSWSVNVCVGTEVAVSEVMDR